MDAARLALIAKYSYISDVLAMDAAIKWLEKRLADETGKNRRKRFRSVIEFLREMRAETSAAVNTKPWRLD